MVCVAGTGGYVVRGKVIDARSLAPLAYAAVRVQNLELWAITNEAGAFTIAHVPGGETTVQVSTLGYVTRTITFMLNNDTDLKNIRRKKTTLVCPTLRLLLASSRAQAPPPIPLIVLRSTIRKCFRLATLWP